MIIGSMATFPARKTSLKHVVKRMASQVDLLNLALNEYETIPQFLKSYKNVNPVIPENDCKDVGKFIFPNFSDEDYVFLLDDDILYPFDYTQTMIEVFDNLPFDKKVLGVHGVIYSDFFDGMLKSRCVYPFNLTNDRHRLVNQLGTGTVLCKGREMPDFGFMQGSELHVDLRFAVFQYRKRIPLVCIQREDKWMNQLSTGDDGIFNEFTDTWPSILIRQACEISGYSKLDSGCVKKLREFYCG